MITSDEVKKIAKLARIEISDKEISEFQGDIDSILEYVGQISSIVKDAKNLQKKTESNQPFNIMREDKDPHQSGIYTEDILASAPDREGDYIKVKKIL